MTVDTPAAPTLAGADRLRRQAVRGGALLLAARLGTQLFQWSVTLFVTRLLEPSDYGMMTAGVLFVGLADMLAEAGLGRALIQKEGLRPSDVAGAFTVSLALAATLYGVLYTMAPVAAAFLEQPDLTGFLPVLGLVVLTIPFRTVALALLDRELRLGRQAAVHVLCSVVQSATVLGMALTRLSVWTYATNRPHLMHEQIERRVRAWMALAAEGSLRGRGLSSRSRG